LEGKRGGDPKDFKGKHLTRVFWRRNKNLEPNAIREICGVHQRNRKKDRVERGGSFFSRELSIILSKEGKRKSGMSSTVEGRGAWGTTCGRTSRRENH